MDYKSLTISYKNTQAVQTRRSVIRIYAYKTALGLAYPVWTMLRIVRPILQNLSFAPVYHLRDFAFDPLMFCFTPITFNTLVHMDSNNKEVYLPCAFTNTEYEGI